MNIELNLPNLFEVIFNELVRETNSIETITSFKELVKLQDSIQSKFNSCYAILEHAINNKRINKECVVGLCEALDAQNAIVALSMLQQFTKLGDTEE